MLNSHTNVTGGHFFTRPRAGPSRWFLINQTHPSIFHHSSQVKQMLSVMQQLLPPSVWRCWLDGEPLSWRPPRPPRTNRAGRASVLPVRQLVPQVDTPESRPNKRGTNDLTRLWDIFRSLCWFPEECQGLPFIDYHINEVNRVYETGYYGHTLIPFSHINIILYDTQL